MQKSKNITNGWNKKSMQTKGLSNSPVNATPRVGRVTSICWMRNARCISPKTNGYAANVPLP